MIDELWNLVMGEDGFIVKLRSNNEFNETMYSQIREILAKLVEEWKKSETVPKKRMLIIVELIEFLAGSSRFFSKEDSIKVEDAELEIKDILNNLYLDL